MEGGAGQSNDEWYEAHVMDLVQKYPNRWVAILDGNVICSSASKRLTNAEAKRLASGREFSLYFISSSALQM